MKNEAIFKEKILDPNSCVRSTRKLYHRAMSRSPPINFTSVTRSYGQGMGSVVARPPYWGTTPCHKRTNNYVNKEIVAANCNTTRKCCRGAHKLKCEQ